MIIYFFVKRFHIYPKYNFWEKNKVNCSCDKIKSVQEECVSECKGNKRNWFFFETEKRCDIVCEKYFYLSGEGIIHCVAECPLSHPLLDFKKRECIKECPASAFLSSDQKQCLTTCSGKKLLTLNQVRLTKVF